MSPRLARLRRWIGLKLCYVCWLHAWGPWHRAGWVSRYRDHICMFTGYLWRRQCQRCGAWEIKDGGA